MFSPGILFVGVNIARIGTRSYKNMSLRAKRGNLLACILNVRRLLRRSSSQ